MRLVWLNTYTISDSSASRAYSGSAAFLPYTRYLSMLVQASTAAFHRTLMEVMVIS